MGVRCLLFFVIFYFFLGYGDYLMLGIVAGWVFISIDLFEFCRLLVV